MRASWHRELTTAGSYLRLVREKGASYSIAELERVEELKGSDLPPSDKRKAD